MVIHHSLLALGVFVIRGICFCFVNKSDTYTLCTILFLEALDPRRQKLMFPTVLVSINRMSFLIILISKAGQVACKNSPASRRFGGF
jgi:hypothetical protein